jgi:hypothetical protein
MEDFMMRVMNVVVFVTVAVFAAAQQSAPPEPWKWAVEQRLSVRFDPVARAERIAEARAETARGRHAAAPANTGDALAGDVLRGREHPELFLPTELFEYLVRDITWNDEFRLAYQQQADDILRTDDDWRAFRVRVAHYAANLTAERQLLEEHDTASRARRGEIDRQVGQLRKARCPLEKEAFRSVRSYFGKDRFDRFLYVVSAPGRAITYAASNSFDETKTRLLAAERDCQ